MSSKTELNQRFVHVEQRPRVRLAKPVSLINGNLVDVSNGRGRVVHGSESPVRRSCVFQVVCEVVQV